MKYVVIGNGQEWCYYSWIEFIEKHDNFSFYTIIPILRSSILTRLCYRYFSSKKNCLASGFLSSIWYRLLFLSLKLKQVDCLIIYDWSQYCKDLSLFSFIKKKKPSIKLVYLFSNIVKVSGADRFGMLYHLKDYFDQVYAFDRLDSERFRFRFNDLVYCGNEIGRKSQIKYDVFYIGSAKDRLDDLHSIYNKFLQANIKCKFFIVGVPEEKQIYKGSITYNQPISYKEVLQYISESRCLVDIIQRDSTAMTIKVCEAVLYDKKLITSNVNIISQPYYNPQNVLIYDETISPEGLRAFMENKNMLYDGLNKSLFSPITLIDKINQ